MAACHLHVFGTLEEKWAERERAEAWMKNVKQMVGTFTNNCIAKLNMRYTQNPTFLRNIAYSVANTVEHRHHGYC